ncbi:MAG: CinA family protein [Planctomycetota bacterium]
MSTDPRDAAAEVLETLARDGRRLVLAESCTGGALAAAFTAVPGASAVFVGSLVTYAAEAKTGWLGVAKSLIDAHGTVDARVSREMAERALAQTDVADVALAVTGHLGPGVGPPLDGTVFIAIALRGRAVREAVVSLQSTTRGDRQSEAVSRCLDALRDALATV